MDSSAPCLDKDFLVTLIRPPVTFSKGGLNISPVNPAIEMAYLTAAANSMGYPVHVVDALLEGVDNIQDVPGFENFQYKGLNHQDIIAKIPEGTRLIGVSCMFSATWPYTRMMIEAIKKALPEIPIIVGGEHMTALPEFTMENCPEIEMGVLGEGEETFLEILEAFSTGQPFKDVAGIIYRQGSTLVQTQRRKRIKAVTEIPWPEWDNVSIDKYLEYKFSDGPYRGRSMPIIATRGCPFKCAFCTNDNMWGILHVAREVKDVVDEIEVYIKKYDIECIEFLDLTAIVSKKWIKAFCREVIARKLKFSWQISGGTRSEGLDEEAIPLMKQSGCKYLCLVPESGSEETLARIGKRVKLDKITHLMKLCIKEGIDTRANLVIGFPDEPRKDIWKTLLYHQRLALMGIIDTPLFIFSPYPGSRYFRELREDGTIPELSDQFFFDLGMEVKISGGRGFCRSASALELQIYQVASMSLFYTISYLVRPLRILSLIRSLASFQYSNSTFEHRILQNFKRFVQTVFPFMDKKV